MKILKRSQYLYLTETPLETFKTLKRRGQVPFFTSDDIDENDSRRVYLGVEAVMLILANDLTRNGGLDRRESSTVVSIISHSPELTINGIRRAENNEDIWIGIFHFFDNNGIDEPLATVGTRIELMNFIDDYKLEDGSRPIETTYRIAMSSVSRAVRQIHEHAPVVGLEISSLLLA